MGRKKTSLFLNNALRIAITNVCDVSAQNSAQSEHMSVETAKAIVDFVKKSGANVRELHITGGEPLLHPEYMEIIKILRGVFGTAKKDKFLYSVDTNASLLTRDVIDSLVEADVSQVVVGLDEAMGRYLNPTDRHITTTEMMDTLGYTRDNMEITMIDRLIVSNENLSKYITFQDRLKLPEPRSANYGCLCIGNKAVGNTYVARFLRQRRKTEEKISTPWGEEFTLAPDSEDYRGNLATYLQEAEVARAKDECRSIEGLGIVALTPDFMDFESTDIRYTPIDIGGSIGLCRLPDATYEDTRNVSSGRFPRMPKINVRNLEISYDEVVDGETTKIVPRYVNKRLKDKDEMGG